ncbi:MAG: hypothetical protein ACKV2O_08820 [Acidimicrobiales bacterium]
MKALSTSAPTNAPVNAPVAPTPRSVTLRSGTTASGTAVPASRRALAPLLGLLVVLVASAGLSACRWRPAAVTVNGHEISAEDLQADLRVLRDNPALADGLVGGPGAIGGPELSDGVVPSQVTAVLLTYRIIEQLVIDAGNASSSRPDDQTFETARKAAYDRLAALLGSAPTDPAADPTAPAAPAAQLVNDADPATLGLLERRAIFEVHGAALLEGLDDQQQAEIVTRVLGGGTVTIDPRYGTWDSVNVQVILPGLPTGDAVTDPETDPQP